MKKHRWSLDSNGKYLRFRGDNGFNWFVGDLCGAGVGEISGTDDHHLRELIVQVLNRELPDGKPRSRKRKES